MGAAGSVGVVDPAALRKEYEAMAAKDVGDEELLNHMKKLIISPQTGGCIVCEQPCTAVSCGRRRHSSKT